MHARANQPVDATLWSTIFSFDVMGDTGFGTDFGSLGSGTEHLASKEIHRFLWIVGVVQSVPWLPNLLSSLPGANVGFATFFDLCGRVLEDKQKVVAQSDFILAYLLTYASPFISMKNQVILCHGCSRLLMRRIHPRPRLQNR